MTGTHILDVDTGVKGGQSTQTRSITDPQSGQTVRYTKTVTSGGTTEYRQVGGVHLNGASDQGTKPKAQTDGWRIQF
jgi:hypothetical protein